MAFDSRDVERFLRGLLESVEPHGAGCASVQGFRLLLPAALSLRLVAVLPARRRVRGGAPHPGGRRRDLTARLPSGSSVFNRESRLLRRDGVRPLPILSSVRGVLVVVQPADVLLPAPLRVPSPDGE